METLQRNSFRTKLFQRAMRFANSLATLPNKITPPPFRLIQIGSAYWQSRALYVAAELGVADIIGNQEMTSDSISEKLNLHTDYLYRLLRMLASVGIFEEHIEGSFRNNKLSHCLRTDSPQSVRDMVLLHNSPQMSHPWFRSLGPALHNGEIPFVQSHGEDLFNYLDQHPEFDALFTGAMEAVESITGDDYLDDFDWGRFDRIIDVGGSNGSKVISILNRHPKLTALVFDRPQVIRQAASYWQEKAQKDILSRITFSGGDMTQSIPKANSEHDLYLFMAIFHGMDDAQATLVLRNLRTACGSHHPTIAIVDMVAETENINPTIASFDMQMLIGTSGRERTEKEWRTLLEKSGFKLQEIVLLRTFAKILAITIH